MRAQVGRHRAAACLRLGVRAASPLRQRTLLQGLLGALRLLEGPGVRLRARTEHPAKLDAVRRPWRAGLELGAGEIVAMAGWPVGELPLPLLGQWAPAPGGSAAGGGVWVVPARRLARVRCREQTGLVAPGRLLTPSTTRICWGRRVLGKSTVLLSHLALADAARGPGPAPARPQRRTWRRTSWRACPEERAGDVVVLDPTNRLPGGVQPAGRARRSMAVVTAGWRCWGCWLSCVRDSWGIR